MNARQHICSFVNRFDNTRSTADLPNWIHVTIGKCGLNMDEEEDFQFRFDFKNDAARKAFGALCHILHTASESWQIITERA